MGDEKETWKVKTLDEILLEKKRRRELEERTDPKRQKNADDRESKRDTPEEGELQDQRMEITIRNSPYTREDSTEDRPRVESPGFFLDHRDRLEQLERQRERDRKLREQQKEQRELKDRERRAEERRKERGARREVPSHHRMLPDEYDEKPKQSHRSRSPTRVPRDRSEHSEPRKILKEEKPESKDLLADLQDISDSERKTSTAESSMEEEEEDEEAGEENYIPDSPPISPVELKKELPKYLPALQGCRSVEEFQCLNRIEEGTYGVVYRAKDKKTDEIVALKRLKMEKEKEGFPITSLREINTILKAQHPNIVTVREIVVGSNMDKIYIVMNYVEHDLKSLMETMKQPFLPGEVKTLMIQLLRGVRHLHDNWILHRDLKTSNLLLSHKGILKIGDFGLAREYGSPLKPYTPVVVTLWYRSPELLLGAKEYSTAVDMWSVGCIFGELLTQKPLFPGKSEIDQINKIFKDLGSPSEKIWPGYSELPAVKKMTFTEYPYNNLRKRFGALLSDQGFDLMNKFLTYCPSKRIVSDDALKHEYFRETPLPIDPSMFPTWPAKSEQQRVKRGTSPRPPEGGLGYSQLGDDDLKETGFHLTTSNQGASAVGPGFSLKF
uniref:cyclin-dependent kinase n=1 Tax=Echeneis naucrates TaxID=173247 RepID=A0A665X4L3_ECHNA